MFLVINGLTDAGWRIDDADSGRVGIDFMMSPFAFVPDRENAELVVRAVNNVQGRTDAIVDAAIAEDRTP